MFTGLTVEQTQLIIYGQIFIQKDNKYNQLQDYQHPLLKYKEKVII